MTTPPCFGQHELFDSTDPAEHRQAAAICSGCPIVAACQTRLLEARRSAAQGNDCGPVGTWAGKLYGAPAPSAQSVAQRRRAAEEERYGELEARECATRWANGERSDYVLLGRRVYERRMRRARDDRRTYTPATTTAA